MSDLDILPKYFPGLSEEQKEKFRKLGPLYQYWNERINVISRKDISHLFIRHILHSLAIAKFIQFPADCRILDVGTGGGFPGIPLAILFPEAEFTLVDSVSKKIKVAGEISKSIECNNIQTIISRAENLNSEFDFIVSRAVTAMPRFTEWVSPLIRLNNNINPAPGIIALKGGDLKQELGNLYPRATIIPVSKYFEEDFFKSKQIVYLPV